MQKIVCAECGNGCFRLYGKESGIEALCCSCGSVNRFRGDPRQGEAALFGRPVIHRLSGLSEGVHAEVASGEEGEIVEAQRK